MRATPHTPSTNPATAPTSTGGTANPTLRPAAPVLAVVVAEGLELPVPVLRVVVAALVSVVFASPTLEVLATLAVLCTLTLVTLARLRLADTLAGKRLAVKLGAALSTSVSAARYVQLEDLPAVCAGGVTGSPWWNVVVTPSFT